MQATTSHQAITLLTTTMETMMTPVTMVMETTLTRQTMVTMLIMLTINPMITIIMVASTKITSEASMLKYELENWSNQVAS